MGVWELLSYRPSLRSAILAGVGVTSAGLLYCYIKRRQAKQLVQDISGDYEPEDSSKQRLKTQLKRLLRQRNVYCADIDYVEEIIDSLIIGGAEQLQVIADFDSTMTPITFGGKPVPSCHCVMEQCPGLPEWFGPKLTKIKDYYFAIEIEPTMTREEKIPFMEEWWDKSHQLLLSTAITKDDVAKAVKISNLYLREGSDKMLKLLSDENIPLLVFSAGVGDVIEQAFLQRYQFTNNMHIIANWMEFSHEGVLVGFKGENIHVFNKNLHATLNSAYFDSIRHRHNVILLGDSLGDLDIAEGLSKHENLLTIGYLNHHVNASMAEYQSKYDIVLVEEDSIELLQSLLNNIISS